ncbi:MAG TPA: NnrS family protein [bacterium]|nr:NnrS family protein [bacterium]
MTEAAPTRRITWQSFSAAPHRLFLWGGGLYAVVAVGLWTLQQAALYTGALPPIVWTVAFPQAHAFMMIYGVLGFYIFGFLLTTFPRWLNTEPVPRRLYVPAWLALMAGTHGFWLGLFLGRGLALAGVLAVLVAYGLVLSACVGVLRRTQSDRTQQVYITAGVLAGTAGVALMAVSLAANATWAYRAARWVGLYPFLLLVVLTVVYRMVPFFTSTVTPGYEVRRSRTALPLFALALLARAALGYAGLVGWTWMADGLLLLTLGRELAGWRFWRAHMPPLLLILYLALGWFVLSFALGTGESLAVLLGAPPGLFHNAALHALAVGGFGGLLLGISTRVSLGHSGGGLATDRLLAGLFWGYQIVPVARVLPDLLGHWLPTLAVQGYWSGVGWVLAFGVWFWRVGPVLMRPRVDGRPG